MAKLACILFVLCSVTLSYTQTILLDGKAISRRFDGIGGLSGGGATSRLLVDYQDPYRSQILDYLFKPYFGASLHILKVEIGGDCQTTDGTEPSHMHTRDDLNFKRGYEWWLMVEAKKRNPDILLYALSWGVPGWIGNGNYFSDDNVDYHVKFLQGAKEVYNLTIDYIGIWNERAFTDDKNCTYIKKLRAGLDAAGFTHTKIVAGDGDWSIVNYLETDPELKKIVDVVGVHYPGTNSPQNAQNLGTTLWASEDYSSFSNNVGDGCWARILNQNWVNGYMTSTISWDLIAAYYPGLPFGGDGLSWSWFPWTGFYQITGTVWGAAHTTQFAFPGWNYLSHGSGSGHLPKGGSYVSLVPPNNNKGDFSLVIETMTHDNSVCIRPNLPPYTVEKQTVTFQVSNLNSDGPYAVWYSHFSANESEVVYFKRLPDIRPKNGQFSLNLDLDSIFTVTSTSGQNKGSYPNPPSPGPFPLPYSDDFESYPIDSEAKYFADQTGVWEIYQGSQSKTMRQVVLQPPIVWCGESSSPISLIGSAGLSDVAIETDVLIESSGTATVGGRVVNGGCGNNYNSGYFFSVNSNRQWTLSAGTKVLRSGSISNWKSGFNTIAIQMTGQNISAYINNNQVVSETDGSFSAGFAAIGSSYNYVQFDNFKLTAKDVNCGSGNLVVMAPCSTDNTRQQWIYNSKDGTIRQRNSNNMCLSLRGTDPHTGAPAATIAPCTSDPSQIWVFSSNAIINKATSKCLDIAGQSKSPCADVELWDCNGGLNQSWQYTDHGLILTTLDGSCLSLGSQQ